jgi:nitrite reductase (cytochrome c-552)
MAEPRNTSLGLLVTVALVAGVVCVGLAALLTNIFERKQEGRSKILRVVEISDATPDPAHWGKNFPLHYDAYRRTTEMEGTLYGGSEAIPHVPSDIDPRDFTSRSKLEMIPQLKRMWAGYAFAVDFREARGHAYMLTDQIYTRRQDVGQPGTCINCHASTYTAMLSLGSGDLHKGFDALNEMTYWEAKEHLSGPVACIDCHDSETMALRISRPSFMNAIAEIKRMDGIENYDVNSMATRQEMRSFVCGQCHVEYYFAGDGKTLTYPWAKGFSAHAALEYYDEIGFKDWVHADTGAPMLKAQHPEFETWNQGVHARSGVSCADCHMPYERVGGAKVSNHHLRSPLRDPNSSCGTCHKVSDAELVERVEHIQKRNAGLTKRALDALVDLIDDIKAAREDGASDAQLEGARMHQRHASFLVDWVEAENSSGFHAPQESAALLGESIDHSRRGQIALRNALSTGTQSESRSAPKVSSLDASPTGG